VRDPRRLVALAMLAALACPACAGARRAPAGIEEPSGVTRLGQELLVVGDDDHGVYYSLRVRGDESGLVPLAPATLGRHPLAAGPAAFDLEGVDVLADGRVVVLSERAPGLFDEAGTVVRYGRDLVELAGRGLEGLAVARNADGSSRVAVLWEGGYLEKQQLPPDLTRAGELPALRPRILVHRLLPGARDHVIVPEDVERTVELATPEPPGREPRAQRFRAPDLVWHRIPSEEGDEDGWIVLMSSGWNEPPEPGSIEECAQREDGKPLRWCHRWLQRFTLAGVAYGAPFDLDDVLPEPVRSANWEGLGWFAPGEKLVLVYDESVAERRLDPQRAFVMDLPAGW
jgi:hypothetical protein